MFFVALFTVARTWKQPKCQSTDEWIEVVHIHNGILLSHKKETVESILMRWINPECIIQSEVSQKEKDKCHIPASLVAQLVKNLPAM